LFNQVGMHKRAEITPREIRQGARKPADRGPSRFDSKMFSHRANNGQMIPARSSSTHRTTTMFFARWRSG